MTQRPMKQIPLQMAPNAAPSFDQYLVGANSLALAQLRGLRPTGPGRSAAAPVYLWGSAGTGKSYLLQALAQAWQQDGQRVSWFHCGLAAPWAIDEHAGLVVLDDCERYDPEQQHAAFALFVDAATRGAVVAAAGRLPPVDLPLRDDLRTRLAWGHVLALQALSEAETRAAVRREADRRGIFLSDDVMDHLLTRFARDLKHLMALLDRLDVFALTHKRAVTVPLLKQMLAEEGPAR